MIGPVPAAARPWLLGTVATGVVVTLGLVAVAIGIGGILFMYSRDLPDHEALANYTPPTISRIYSREGMVVDEFATERRLFEALAT